jgi:glycosyltransferase involved in cell wall biosynthesis
MAQPQNRTFERNCFLSRPKVSGKFLLVDGEKFYVRGVTYGTFRPNETGENFPAAEIIEKDFALMTEFGINSVRTYTVPPLHLLDIAQKYNLKVLVGLPWEQHITFLDEPQRVRDIENRIRENVQKFAGHPAILAYTLGNEIPAQIVRWYGKKRIEKFIKRLYRAGKETDSEALFTYVNYPTTEYLDLSFTDFDCFNVYLETKEKLESYLKRLHNLVGDRPLVMAEIGLDSLRNGDEKQSETLDWQIRSVFSSGCAGTFIFAWTDEWWRGGFDIEDWDFGLTTRERKPKPALPSVAQAFAETPFPISENLPKISVVCCSYNGSATIRHTLDALLELDYPNFEVIVINDGSTDNLREIVEAYPFRLFNTPNRGLSNARNLGMEMAVGDIVAYIDDDAYPDNHWLNYLAHAFMTTNHAGIGGPNIPPIGDGIIAESVANAPGGPVHVLLTDDIAEHIPGCNMAFRRRVLEEVGGCDGKYTAAGDDVDLCWRIQEKGYTIGFHPSAVVWHHRRNSIKMYWRQQKGYGKAEALLEEKWSSKYNCYGHLTWGGRIYGNGLTLPLKTEKDQVFHGTWGTALFQSIYQTVPNTFSSIPLMPEWYFIVLSLGVLSSLGLFWRPLLLAVPLFLISIFVIFLQAGLSAKKAVYATPPKTKFESFYRWGLTAFLHLIQPLARLYGRITHGLTPWRKRGVGEGIKPSFLLPKTHNFVLWSETWRSAEDWLQKVE